MISRPATLTDTADAVRSNAPSATCTRYGPNRDHDPAAPELAPVSTRTPSRFNENVTGKLSSTTDTNTSYDPSTTPGTRTDNPDLRYRKSRNIDARSPDATGDSTRAGTDNNVPFVTTPASACDCHT